jgi:hypothetical protein
MNSEAEKQVRGEATRKRKLLSSQEVLKQKE